MGGKNIEAGILSSTTFGVNSIVLETVIFALVPIFAVIGRIK